MPSNANNMTGQLLIVLVLYEMPVEHSPAFRSLTLALLQEKKSCAFYIHDNSTVPQPSRKSLKEDDHYIHDPSNPGVGVAYNRAAVYARETGRKWLLLSDQDTVFPLDVFSQYEASMALFPSHRVFVPIMQDDRGIVSPYKFSRGHGIRQKKMSAGVQRLNPIQFINSGTLIEVATYLLAGGYDPGFRLDFSDLVFQRRLQTVAPEFILITATCSHALSSSIETSAGKSLSRFEIYSRAAAVVDGPWSWPRTRQLLRATKLSLKFRNIHFLITGLRNFFLA